MANEKELAELEAYLDRSVEAWAKALAPKAQGALNLTQLAPPEAVLALVSLRRTREIAEHSRTLTRLTWGLLGVTIVLAILTVVLIAASF